MFLQILFNFCYVQFSLCLTNVHISGSLFIVKVKISIITFKKFISCIQKCDTINSNISKVISMSYTDYLKQNIHYNFIISYY